MKIKRARRLRGTLHLPGDKSVSHRAAMIAALADGRTRIENFSDGADCAATVRVLRALGVRIEQSGNTLSIEGIGAHGNFRAPQLPLDCANSGTTIRLLAGLIASQAITATLTGDASLRSRPMRRIIEPLEMMGAQVASDDGRAPLTVRGRAPLRAIDYEMPVASAQVKSAILLAALRAEGRTSVIERIAPTRDHTERMLRWFGANVETRSELSASSEDSPRNIVMLEGGASLAARDVNIAGDISSAAYFLVAAALLPDSEIELKNTGINPTRVEILRALRAWGAHIAIVNERGQCGEPVADILVRSEATFSSAPANNERVILRGAQVAALIDELPLLAITGTQLEGGLEIRDAAELRAKESDRISATVENLRAMNASVEEFADGLRVSGRAQLRGAKLDAHGDHRIAMAFAVAALVAEGETEIVGAQECVGVSFPEFFRLLEEVAER